MAVSARLTEAPPAGVSRDLEAALARVRSVAGKVVGCGFLIDHSHLVTCAHVVAAALGQTPSDGSKPEDVLTIDFPLLAPGETVQAQVAAWHPVQSDDRGDIAVLSILGPTPAGMVPVRLVAANDFWGHPFRAFGFPRNHDHGVWVSGILRARQSVGWVQMEGAASGHAVEGGFSGGAVWDDTLAAVVGMTVAAESQNGARTAYLIAADHLVQAWPALADETLPACPYRGLSPFRMQDQLVFFGREDVIERLTRDATHRPIVSVVGPSGSGKSSVLFAGLLTQAEQRGWTTISLRPAQARTPILSLAGALMDTLEPDASETERITALTSLAKLIADGHGPDIIGRVLERSQAPHMLLAIDQFEELLVRNPSEITEFTDVMLSAVRAHQGPIGPRLTVVLTLRADFLNTVLQIPAMADALEDSVIAIGQMSRDRLREVIERPLPADITFQTGLVDRILDDVGEGSGSLPLLEFALTLLWEKQEHRVLTHAAYQALGGVDGALAAYAERVYNEQLLPGDQDQARRLFVQLARPSDVGTPVRRVARPPELGERRWQLAQRLAATRLLVTDRDPTGSESVELVHEALITGWSRLNTWIEEDRAFRAWQEQLRNSLMAWEHVRRDPGALLRGAPLADAERWLTQRSGDVAASEASFIRLSAAWRGRSLRRLTAAVVTLTLLLLAATALGGTVIVQYRQNAEQRRIAGSRHLASQVEAVAGADLRLAMLLALSAYKMSPTPESIRALTSAASVGQQIDSFVRPAVPGDIERVQFSSTDPNLLAISGSNYVALWDIRNSSPPTVRMFDARPTSTTFSADGKLLVVEATSGTGSSSYFWWSVRDNQIRQLTRIKSEGVGDFSSMTLSSDGELLAICHAGEVQLWRVRTQSRLFRSGQADLSQYAGCDAGFTSENNLVYAKKDRVVVWDPRTHVAVAEHKLPTSARSPEDQCGSGIPSITMAPNGRTAAIDDGHGRLWWWHLDPARTPWSLAPDSDDDCSGAEAVGFSSDSSRAMIYQGESFTIENVADGAKLGVLGLPVFGDNIPSVVGSLSADGETVATPLSQAGDTIALLGTRPGVPLMASEIAVAEQDPNQVAGLAGNRVRFYSYEPMNQQFQSFGDIELADDIVDDLDRLSPTGRHVALVRKSSPTDVQLFDLTDRRRALPVTLHGDGTELTSIAFSPRGGFVATADASHITLWSVADKSKLADVSLPSAFSISQVAVSADGKFVAAMEYGGRAIAWRRSTSEQILLTDRGAGDLSFSPSADQVGVLTSQETQLWDLELRTKVATLQSKGEFGYLTFSLDGRYLLALDQSGSASVADVWQLPGREFMGSMANVRSAVFLPGRDEALTTGPGGVQVTSFGAKRAAETVCRVTNDGRLTAAEWDRHAPGFDYVAACP